MSFLLPKNHQGGQFPLLNEESAPLPLRNCTKCPGEGMGVYLGISCTACLAALVLKVCSGGEDESPRAVQTTGDQYVPEDQTRKDAALVSSSIAGQGFCLQVPTFGDVPVELLAEECPKAVKMLSKVGRRLRKRTPAPVLQGI